MGGGGWSLVTTVMRGMDESSSATSKSAARARDESSEEVVWETPREQAGLSTRGLEDEGKRVWDDDFGHTAHRKTDNRRTIYLGAHCTALIPKKCSETCENEMRYITSTKMNTEHSDSKIRAIGVIARV